MLLLLSRAILSQQKGCAALLRPEVPTPGNSSHRLAALPGGGPNFVRRYPPNEVRLKHAATHSVLLA